MRPPKSSAGSRPRPRRALSNAGGAVTTRGPDELSAPLAQALLAANVKSFEPDERRDARATHGFHSYPARMHPDVAAAALARYARPGTRVLDPFCGSGTVLIEALLAGCEPVGVDLSPLAVLVARAQTSLYDAPSCERLARTLQLVTEASLERVRGRVPVRAPLSARERAQYDPHVVLELAGLREEIDRVEVARDRAQLELVFSALLVKFSKQRADTSGDETIKRIRKGLPSEFFLRKGRELCARLADLAQRAPASAREPRVYLGDARELSSVLRDEPRFDLVLSSPPYGGTYDYHAHHARRYAWLRLDADPLERGEVGARRRLSSAADGARRWDQELLACLRAIAKRCKRDANVLLLTGDAEVGGERIDAADQLRALAPRAGLIARAAASQVRIDHRGGPVRFEHLVLLQLAPP